MDNNSLSHHGILGMKWGVRRYQNKDGTLTISGKRGKSMTTTENTHDDHKKSNDSKSVKSMSDAELRQRLNRLQMEKQYSQLTKKETSAGAEFVKNVMVNAAQQTASKYVSKYMSKGIDAGLEYLTKKG